MYDEDTEYMLFIEEIASIMLAWRPISEIASVIILKTSTRDAGIDSEVVPLPDTAG
jgi:hypothetical protein